MWRYHVPSRSDSRLHPSRRRLRLTLRATIAVRNFACGFPTQSPSMLSETYHSISDTGNQVASLIGPPRGRRLRGIHRTRPSRDSGEGPSGR
ncbi:hypothetical protein C8039_08530 [Halogeometricum sp. wsp3]|nr:hypothetical protein C8039_08530 [Halogeometricum sp. wsp3]